MLTPFDIFALALGLVAGIALALVHAWLSRRAVADLVAGGSRWRLLAGFPVRVILPALGLASLSLISTGSLLVGALAFVIGQRLALRRGST